jgi:hypothetical protein
MRRGLQGEQQISPSNRESVLNPAELDRLLFSGSSPFIENALEMANQDPNAYFFRNLLPGECAKHGKWTDEEKDHFMVQLGLALSESPQLPKWGLFSMRIPGRAGYQCRDLYNRLVKAGLVEARESARSPPIQPLSRYERNALENPLKDAVDSITQEEIRVPAICPEGYVLDYETWTKCLGRDPVHPFLRTDLSRRQLTILTKDNIAQYRDKIKSEHSFE